MSIVIELCDAVVSEINSHQWMIGIPLSHREYVPVSGLKDLEIGKTSVCPGGVKKERLTRARNDNEVEIQIGIQKKFDEESECDIYIKLVEEMADYFLENTLAEYSTAACLEVEILPLYAQEHITELRTFTSVLKLTYKVAE